MSGNLLEFTLQRAFEDAKKHDFRRSRAKSATQDTLKRELQRGVLTLSLVPFAPVRSGSTGEKGERGQAGRDVSLGVISVEASPATFATTFLLQRCCNTHHHDAALTGYQHLR